jgi:hypothetical protein
MNRYIVRAEQGVNAIHELSIIGKVEYISSVLNVFRVFTDIEIDEIRKINHVEFVQLEDDVELI